MRVIGYLMSPAAKAVIKRYPVAATVAYLGKPLLTPAANGAGLAAATTTNLDSFVGLAQELATYQTGQNTNGSDPAAYVAVIINPDQIIKAKLSGGAAENTALTKYAITTATTDGLACTTGSEWSNPEYDEGVVWGYDGVNAGIVRKLTSTSSTAGTVTVAFPGDHQVGDNFLRAPIWPWQANTVTLTTNLTQVRADVAVATNTAALRCIQVEGEGLLMDKAGDGLTKSSAIFIPGQHVMSINQ